MSDTTDPLPSPHLRAALRRIPDDCPQIIGVGPGWHALVNHLQQQIADVGPDYVIHQVKEKFGTLRFYWGWPELEPTCCARHSSHDPRPAPGPVDATWAPEARTREQQDALEQWAARRDTHLASDEHAAAWEALAPERQRRRQLTERIQRLVDAAERTSAHTCENCGDHGTLHIRRNWIKTLCPACAAESGHTPVLGDRG